MKVYMALFDGSDPEKIINRSINRLGGPCKAIILEPSMELRSVHLVEDLKKSMIECNIKPSSGYGYGEVMFDVVSTYNETFIEFHERNNKDNLEFFLDISNLDKLQSGAMFVAAGKIGASVISYNEDTDRLDTMVMDPFPNVSKLGYTVWKILEDLYNEVSLTFTELNNGVYADKIANMNEDSKSEFFKTHHHVYKVLEKMEASGWIRQEKKSKTYRITPKGNTIRTMINLRDWKAKNKGKLDI